MFTELYSIGAMRALALASGFSLFAISAAQAIDGPGSPGDNNGRATAALHSRDWHPIVASDGPGNPTHNTGRSAALATDGRFVVAGGRGGISGEV